MVLGQIIAEVKFAPEIIVFVLLVRLAALAFLQLLVFCLYDTTIISKFMLAVRHCSLLIFLIICLLA